MSFVPNVAVVHDAHEHRADRERANTDFATGSGVTLKLDAPAGWQFNAGAGSVNATNGREITASGKRMC